MTKLKKKMFLSENIVFFVTSIAKSESEKFACENPV